MTARNPDTQSLAPLAHTLCDDGRILQERARLLAQPPAQNAAPEDVIEVVAFHSGSDHFGVPTAMVHEIQALRTLQWSPVPCAPAFIVGLINLRGHLYSIMDLARFLGQPAQPISDNAHILLVMGGTCDAPHGGAMELTLLTNDLPTIERGPANRLYPAPATLSQTPGVQDYVRGVTADMLVIIDLERLLSDPRIIVNDA